MHAWSSDQATDSMCSRANKDDVLADSNLNIHGDDAQTSMKPVRRSSTREGSAGALSGAGGTDTARLRAARAGPCLKGSDLLFQVLEQPLRMSEVQYLASSSSLA